MAKSKYEIWREKVKTGLHFSVIDYQKALRMLDMAMDFIECIHLDKIDEHERKETLNQINEIIDGKK